MRTPLLIVLALATLATGCNKEIVCPSGETACGNTCFALHRDPTNCGACGHACGPLEVCTDGACGCAPDVTACGGGACADLRIDPQNCGTCGTACGGATPLCDGDAGGCVAAGGCTSGETECASGCVDLQTHPRNCGACGHACAPGESCRGGTCAADTYIACYWTNEVKPVTRALGYGGPSIDLGTARPSRVAITGDTLLVAAGQPQASVSFVPLADGSATTVALPGWDLEGILVHENAVLVSNAAVGTLEVLALDGTVLDEIPLPDQQNYPNPLGFAAYGTDVYVALNAAQKIAKIDLSQLSAWHRADPGRRHATRAPALRSPLHLRRLPARVRNVSGTIDLASVAGVTDGAGLRSVRRRDRRLQGVRHPLEPRVVARHL
jgi:hypothetical protein